MSRARSMLKDGLRRMVAAAAPCMWHVGTGSRLLILMYHRVLPRGDAARQFEQPGMIVPEREHDRHFVRFSNLSAPA